jgi:flagellar biogenesis protein FliO
MFQTITMGAATWDNYGLFILETLAALAVIALGAWALVRFGSLKLARGKEGSRMRVIERLPLEPKRTLYLVELDGMELLVGVSEGAMGFMAKGEDGQKRTAEDVSSTRGCEE